MSQLVVFLLLGLGTGALTAGLSLSLVASYRGVGVIDLGAGAVAALGAFLFYGLRTGGYLWLPKLPILPRQIRFGGPMGIAPSLVITLALCAVGGGVLEFLVYRRLRTAAPLAKLVASVGLLLTVEAVLTLRFGTTGQFAPSVLPSGSSDVVNILGSTIPTDRIVLAVVVLVIAAALALLYRRTRFGLATRAAAESDEHAVLRGLDPDRISLTNAVLAAVLAGLIGVLAAPLTQLNPSTIPLAVIPALAAALIARFSSFLTAAAAGLGIGLLQSVIVYLQTKSWFPTSGGAPVPGIAELLTFVIIVIALAWRGSSLPLRGTLRERALPPSPRPQNIERIAATIGVVAVIGFLVLPFDFRQGLIFTLIGFIVSLSLVVMTGYVGQISFVQIGLGGVAGFVITQIGVRAGIGFPLAPIAGVAAATAAGVVIGASAFRVRGILLGVVTLAAADALDQFGFSNPIWGASASGSPVGSPHLFGLNLGFTASFPINDSGIPSPVLGFMCVVAAVGVGVLIARLRCSDLGRRMLAVRSNETAAAAAGVDVRSVKLTAFVISSALAGLAGVLYAYAFQQVSEPDYDVFSALGVVAFTYIGGITSMTGAVIGGLGITGGIVGYAAQKWLGISGEYQLAIGGIALMVAVVKTPDGIAGALSRSNPLLTLRDRFIPAHRGPAAGPTSAGDGLTSSGDKVS
jgi:branched-chain amino acid transport system permease protein